MYRKQPEFQCSQWLGGGDCPRQKIGNGRLWLKHQLLCRNCEYMTYFLREPHGKYVRLENSELPLAVHKRASVIKSNRCQTLIQPVVYHYDIQHHVDKNMINHPHDKQTGVFLFVTLGFPVICLSHWSLPCLCSTGAGIELSKRCHKLSNGRGTW